MERAEERNNENTNFSIDKSNISGSKSIEIIILCSHILSFTLNLSIDVPYFNIMGKMKGDNNNFAVKSQIRPIGKCLMCSPLANSKPFLSNISIVANPNVFPTLFAFATIITSFPAGMVCNISVDK